MMEFLFEYGLYLAKSVTFLLVALVAVAGIAGVKRGGSDQGGEMVVTSLNEHISDGKKVLQKAILSSKQNKEARKADCKKSKKSKDGDGRLFVIDFYGDTDASGVDSLREEITSVLTVASKSDEVMINLESCGGAVHSYGLASSQIARIKSAGIPLTICVDKVAASGGYMMACVADKIIAAPFAVVGSIGVVAQIPNINRLLTDFGVDVELFTAGEHKRTVTVMGKNDDKGREKFKEDLSDTHGLFKGFISKHRPSLDVAAVSNGDTWYGSEAVGNGLIDEVSTSDSYISNRAESAKVYKVEYKIKKTIKDRLGLAAKASVNGAISSVLGRIQSSEILK